MRGIRAVIVVAALLSLTRLTASAQQLRVSVHDRATGRAIVGATIILRDSVGATRGRVLTNQFGEMRASLDEIRSLRAIRLGFRPAEQAVPRSTGGDVRVEVIMEAIPTFLDPVRVTANARCSQRDDRASALSLLEHARAGLLATVVARTSNPVEMTRLVFERSMRDGQPEMQTVRREVARATASFNAAHTASEFLASGFMKLEPSGVGMFFAPDADVLLDDAFSLGYCFHLMPPERGRVGQIGLGFRPPDSRRGRVDVDGALWIDTTAKALVDIVFRYTGLAREMEALQPGGRVAFQDMGNGVVLIDRWVMRLVGFAASAVPSRLFSNQKPVDRMLVSEVGGELARAKFIDGFVWNASLGTLRVTALNADGTPAVGTLIHLAYTNYTGTADSLGIATINQLLPGPYVVEVIDPLLAELEIPIPITMRFEAFRDSTMARTLRVPTAADFIHQRCRLMGQDDERDSVLMLARIVSPQGEPVRGARVNLFAKDAPNIWRQLPFYTRTGSDGLFAACSGLKGGLTVRVEASSDDIVHASVPLVISKNITILTIPWKP